MRNRVIALLLSLVVSNMVYASTNIVEERLKILENDSPFEIRENQAKREIVHDSFYNNHTIVFFYSSRCHFCHQFAPIFKRWLDNKGLSVRAISLDNRPISEFPNIEQKDESLINAAYGDMPHGTPAVFIINEKTQAIYPAAYGNLSSEELNFRMINLVSKIQDFERRA